jgi:hypothetical protein
MSYSAPLFAKNFVSKGDERTTCTPKMIERRKDLETENARLRKAVSDLTLDKLILQAAAKGTS